MTIREEISIESFQFWSGAEDRADKLTYNELVSIGKELEDMYPDGMTATELNDLFWFDFDSIAQMIGETEDSILERK